MGVWVRLRQLAVVCIGAVYAVLFSAWTFTCLGCSVLRQPTDPGFAVSSYRGSGCQLLFDCHAVPLFMGLSWVPQAGEGSYPLTGLSRAGGHGRPPAFEVLACGCWMSCRFRILGVSVPVVMALSSQLGVGGGSLTATVGSSSPAGGFLGCLLAYFVLKVRRDSRTLSQLGSSSPLAQ